LSQLRKKKGDEGLAKRGVKVTPLKQAGMVSIDLVEDDPAYCRGVGLDDLWGSLPAQAVL